MNQLANIDTDLFVVVSELPTEDIKEGKIYCIRDTSSTAQDNNYIEYAYINNKWEKVGEFQAKPDLSNYAKLSGADFRGTVRLNKEWYPYGYVMPTRGKYFWAQITDPNKAYVSNGDLADIGTQEDLMFTLEDGTKVIKTIRVISTTIQAEA